jgi:ParB-like chromosome segregation protein Spo0J
MARLKDKAISVRDMFNLDPRVIVVEDGFNVRDFTLAENLAHVRALADSIKAVGRVTNPVVVRYQDDQIILVDGECRLRASLLAIEEGFPLATIPAIADERGQNEADRALSFFSRNAGKNLKPLEQSAAVARAVALGLTVAQIAERTGVTMTWISELLTLAEAPERVKMMVREGSVSPTVAASVVRKNGSRAEDVLREAQHIAQAAGKTRVTPKHLPARHKADSGVASAPAPCTQQTRDASILMRALSEIAFTTTDQKTKELATKALAYYDGATVAAA